MCKTQIAPFWKHTCIVRLRPFAYCWSELAASPVLLVLESLMNCFVLGDALINWNSLVTENTQRRFIGHWKYIKDIDWSVKIHNGYWLVKNKYTALSKDTCQNVAVILVTWNQKNYTDKPRLWHHRIAPLLDDDLLLGFLEAFDLAWVPCVVEGWLVLGGGTESPLLSASVDLVLLSLLLDNSLNIFLIEPVKEGEQQWMVHKLAKAVDSRLCAGRGSIYRGTVNSAGESDSFVEQLVQI